MCVNLMSFHWWTEERFWRVFKGQRDNFKFLYFQDVVEDLTNLLPCGAEVGG